MSLLTLKGCKIPTKEVKVKIFGKEQEITIYPIGGFGLLKIQQLADAVAKNDDDVEAKEALVKFALLKGTKCSEDDVQFLIENDLIACMSLTNEILNYSKDYNEEKLKEEEKSKKK